MLIGMVGRVVVLLGLGALLAASRSWSCVGVGNVVVEVEVDGMVSSGLRRLILALDSTSTSTPAAVLVLECRCGATTDAEVEVDMWPEADMWLLSPLLFEVLVRWTKRFMRWRREEVRVIVWEGMRGADGCGVLFVLDCVGGVVTTALEVGCGETGDVGKERSKPEKEKDS